MKMKDHICHIYAWVLMTFMLVLPACDRTEDDLLPDDQVRLKASLAPALSTVYTKGGGEITSVHASDLNIGLTKVQGDNASFDGAEASAITAVMKADEDNDGLRDIEFGAFQAFPSADGIVNYIAWYPQSATYSNPNDDGRTTVTFTVDGSTDILYSDVASGNRRTGFNTMTFRHALVKYSVMVYGTEETEGSVAGTWGQIQSVVLNGMHEECLLTLPPTAKTDGHPSVPIIGTTSDTTGFWIYKSGDIPIGFSNAMEMGYILAPAPEGNILKINITTENKTIEDLDLSVSSTFQPGKHYKIYLRFSPEGVINAEIVVAVWQDGDDIYLTNPNGTVFYDLSETHTANSYIVSAPNSYCFNATVRGNGYTGIAGIPGAAADLYLLGGEPVSAEIVWTDLVGESDNLDQYFTLSPKVVGGRVFFSVKPDSESLNKLKEGNVVIGVKDAAGNMLWTWHIWITDRPAEQGYKNGFAVQDRDLGATAYAPTGDIGNINGFYYQWGRPTPLPLGKTVYKPKYNTTGAWISNETVSFTTSADTVTVINRVAEPTVYFTQKATATDALLTKNLWGWRNETDEYTKTVYDPCPPGYRVPSIKLWRDLVILDEDGNGSHDAKLVKNGKNENIAVSFKVDANHLQIYYPMTGYYTNLTTSVDYGTGAYMWAATYDLGANLNDASDDQPYALDFAIDGNEVLEQMETKTEFSNYAMPVRCISRMSKAHVTDLSDYQTANSYIVSKKGYYKFKAVVRGNGIGKLVPPGSTSSIDLTEQLQTVDMKSQLVKVEPLWWHSYASQDAPSADNFAMLNDGRPDQDGFVSFEVEAMKEGNMILAGYDAKGEIIWSWHIWLTDEPAMMKSNSFVVMDRNLGATFAPKGTTEPTGTNLTETYGFYYQWGRKDPFARPDGNIHKYSSGAWTEEAVAVSSAFKTQSVAANKTVGNSVANPMTYHLASGTIGGIFSDDQKMSGTFSITNNNDSADNQCFSTMVKPEDRRSLWGYSAASGYGVTTTKTMYDPCPPGYMVAHYLVWTNTERDSSDSKLYYSNLDGGFREHNIVDGTGGIFLNDSRYVSLFDKAWYPFTGYIKGNSFTIDESGSVGVFHTSTPAGNGSRSLMYDNDQSGQAVDENYRGLPSSFGYPVRCQKE